MHAPPSARSRLLFRLLLVSYPLLLVGGLVSGRAALSSAAALVLLTLLLWPGLRTRSVVAWALWIAVAACAAWLARTDRGALALLCLPVLINVTLAWVFARTLKPGETPLVARAIIAIEGEERLALPGVAVYARRLTLAWSLVLTALACVLALNMLVAFPGGWFASQHQDVAIRVPLDRALWFGHLGVYVVVGTFFILEYAWRRWYFRSLPHPSPRQFVQRLMRGWPTLLHSRSPSADKKPSTDQRP